MPRPLRLQFVGGGEAAQALGLGCFEELAVCGVHGAVAQGAVDEGLAGFEQG